MIETEKAFTGSSAEDLIPDKKYWFVVYTRPNYEIKVARLLAKKKIEHYCPKVKVRKQLHNKWKISEEPLFRSYVFVYISESGHRAVKQVAGIKNFVYWLNNPVIILKEEIENIQAFLNLNTNLWHYDYEIQQNTSAQKTSEVQYFGNKRILAVKGNAVELEVSSLKCVLVSQNNMLRVHPIDTWKARYMLQNSSINNDVVYQGGISV